MNTKISEVENKIPDNSEYITTQEFNKLTEINFAARLKQADSVKKETDFDHKLTTFNKRISLRKQSICKFKKKKKEKSLITRDYNFSLDGIDFISNDGSQNTCIYQPTFDTL